MGALLPPNLPERPPAPTNLHRLSRTEGTTVKLTQSYPDPVFELERLSGVLVALVTPMTRDGGVDEPAVTRLVEHVLGGGVHGLLALGSTGETASLDEVSRRTMLKA